MLMATFTRIALNPRSRCLKRGIVGTWHRISAKHLQAYLDEMCFRFDNRKNPYLFRDTLLKLLQAEHLEYKELIATAAA